MNGSIQLVTVATDQLAGAYSEMDRENLTDWPEKPTGTAERSERGESGFRLVDAADADAAGLPELQLFEDINFGGATWRTNLNYLYVGGWWNDRISSIIINSGTWRFYQHRDFKGAYWDLRGPAYYWWVEDANIPNDIISSFRCIAL